MTARFPEQTEPLGAPLGQARESGGFEREPPLPWAREQGVSAVLARLRSQARVAKNLTLDATQPAREASDVPMLETLDPRITAALDKRGIRSLYSHQRAAIEHALAGRDVVIATPTASGKSLCFHVPVLQALCEEPQARALYVFPTKALARDQEAGLRALLTDAGLRQGAITYDGDTPGDARRAAREQGGVIITNPDMLHAGILPHHAAWARFFANLRYVVIDELHAYRGVFGSHLANVLRRLERIARFHGSTPRFVLASATIGNPDQHAARMLSRKVELVAQSGAPEGARRVLVYNPPVVNAELGVRESYLKAAVRLTSELVRAGVTTLVFGQSRNSVEVMLKYLRERLARDHVPPERVAAYRGGYLPELRRSIERGLREGTLSCVVATSALELGIDIGALDAVVCAGYPGTLAGLKQRFGRGGRRGSESLALLVSSSAALDQYVAMHSEHVLSGAIEEARIDPDNIEILLQHIKCAAFELPFSSGDCFGDVPADVIGDALEHLREHRLLHAAGSDGARRYHWASDAYPANDVSLRSVGWDNVVIIEVDREHTLAEMDFRSAHTMLHEQAIYQHEGEQYQVERLDLDNRKAYVRKVAPDYFTNAMTHVRVSAIERGESSAYGEASCELGEVSVVEKVVGYKKIKFNTHENVGYGDVHLPEMQMHTTAFWLTVPESVVARMVARMAAPRAEVIDALRGLGHALHLVASMGLMTDPADLGIAMGGQAEAGAAPGKGNGELFDPTLFLYDRVPGGIGLAPRIFAAREELLRRARFAVEGCGCADGCPACLGAIVAPIDPSQHAVHGARRRLALEVLSQLGVPATS